MRIKWWLITLALITVQVTAARDPFEQLVTRCEPISAQRWEWRGLVSVGQTHAALFQGVDKKWQRVRPGSDLPGGITIASVSEQEVVATVRTGCEPQTLRWTYQEKKNEGTHHITVTSVAASQRPERAGKPRVADRGRGTGGAGITSAGRERASQPGGGAGR